MPHPPTAPRNPPLYLSVALSAALILTPVHAQTAPITVDPGSGPDPISQIFGGFDTGISTVVDGFSTVDSTIGMLSRVLDMAQYVPVIGAIAQIIRPVLNTYIDIRATAQPLLDAANRGRDWLNQATAARNNLNRIFTSSNLEDGVNNINTLVNQLSGLTGLPLNARKISATDPRGSVNRIITETDHEIAKVEQAAREARRTGDVSTYQYLTRRTLDMQRLRARLRQAGDSAAAQREAKILAEKSNRAATIAAQKTQGFANTLAITQSSEGAIKALGTVALEQLNSQAAGFDTLSQQLALLSQQQTTSNEQTDQLLQHFQEQERERSSQIKMALDQQTQRRQEEYRAMVKRSASLADSIAQTMQPAPTNRTPTELLMKGRVR